MKFFLVKQKRKIRIRELSQGSFQSKYVLNEMVLKNKNKNIFNIELK